jgi:curved DNA-binding protein CbpA
MRSLCLLLLVACAYAVMSRSEAQKILRLPARFDERALKTAYRARSMETHPDKGGTTEAFLKVSEAYETLSSGSSGSGDGMHGFSEGMSKDEMLRRAEEMLDSVLDDFEDLLKSLDAGAIVDELFGSAGKNPLKWLLKKAAKAGVRTLARMASGAMHSESTTVTVNGQTISGAEFQRWREQRRRAVRKNSRRREEIDEL